MRILVVDDHAMFAESIRLLFASRYTIGTASTGSDALEQITEAMPQAVLLDQNLPDIDGLTLLKVIRALPDPPPVVLLSGSDEPTLVEQARRSGAVGFLHKSMPAQALMEAMDRVAGGLEVWPESAASCELSGVEVKPVNVQIRKELGITSRQLDVLQLLVSGAPNKVIANDLGIAESTVKSHVKSLFQVFKVTNRVACYNRAMELGLLQDDQAAADRAG